MRIENTAGNAAPVNSSARLTRSSALAGVFVLTLAIVALLGSMFFAMLLLTTPMSCKQGLTVTSTWVMAVLTLSCVWILLALRFQSRKG